MTYYYTMKTHHLRYLEDHLKALLKNGLKTSSKKYKHFRTQLPYVGSVLFIKGEFVSNH